MWAKRRWGAWLIAACGLAIAGCDLSEYDDAIRKKSQQLLIGAWSSQRDLEHPLIIDAKGNVQLWTGNSYSRSVRPMVIDPSGRGFRTEIVYPDGQKKAFAGSLLTDDRLSVQLLEKPEVGYMRTVVYARVPAKVQPGAKKK